MNISIIRGTSNTFNITLQDPEGQPYFLAAGEVLRFGVKTRHTEESYIIEKELTAEDLKNGVYPVKLLPEDTAGLCCYSYCYDVGVQSGDDYWIVIPCSPFVVEHNITQREGVADG